MAPKPMYSDDTDYDVSLEVSTTIKTYSLDFIRRLRTILSFITVSYQHIVCTGAKFIQGIGDATLIAAVERGGNSKSPYFSSDALKTRLSAPTISWKGTLVIALGSKWETSVSIFIPTTTAHLYSRAG